MPSCMYEAPFRLVAADVSRLYDCISLVYEKLCSNSTCASSGGAGWIVSSHNSCLVVIMPPRPVAASLQALPASYESNVLIECKESSDVVSVVKLLETVISTCKGVGLAPRER